MLGFRRKRGLPLPPDPLHRLTTLGRFEFDVHSSGIDSTVAREDCISPFRPASVADPEGFLGALRELVADDPGGFATYGAYRVSGELLGFENRSPNALALLDAAIAFKRARGLPSARLTGYEWARWCAVHGPGSW